MRPWPWVLALFVAPTALGAWSFQGMVEPDTDDDTGWTWPEGDGGAGPARVYLNGYLVQGPGPVRRPEDRSGNFDLFPAVALNQIPGSRMAPVGALEARALFGLWKDCDGDGYVGNKTLASWKYPPAFLPEGSPCTGPPFLQERTVIVENVAGGMKETAVVEYVYWWDPDARLWGDFGPPGAPPTRVCRDLPVPREAVRSSGGLLQYVDCQTGFLVGTHLAVVDATAGTDLAFDDPYHPEADCDHPLNRQFVWKTTPDCDGRVNPWSEGDPPACTVWDSNDPGGTLVVEGFPVGEMEYEGEEVYGTSPSVAPGGNGSLYEAALLAVEQCAEGGLVRTVLEWYTQMDSLERRALPFPFILGGPPPTDPRDPKRESDFVLAPKGGSFNPLALEPWLLQDADGAHWESRFLYAAPGYKGPTVRSGSVEPATPLWITFYGKVGPASLAVHPVPQPQGAVYGYEACGGQTTGTHGGWDCNVDHWWNPHHGARENPTAQYGGTVPLGPYPGWTYHLRDVDCLDGHVFGEVLYAGLTPLGAEGTCP